MLSPVIASRPAISFGHTLQWPGIQWKDSWPNQIGSDRGPDCPHSIWGREVRSRVQEGAAGVGVCKDSQGDEWASGVMLKTPCKGMTEGL